MKSDLSKFGGKSSACVFVHRLRLFVYYPLIRLCMCVCVRLSSDKFKFEHTLAENVAPVPIAMGLGPNQSRIIY